MFLKKLEEIPEYKRVPVYCNLSKKTKNITLKDDLQYAGYGLLDTSCNQITYLSRTSLTDFITVPELLGMLSTISRIKIKLIYRSNHDYYVNGYFSELAPYEISPKIIFRPGFSVEVSYTGRFTSRIMNAYLFQLQGQGIHVIRTSTPMLIDITLPPQFSFTDFLPKGITPDKGRYYYRLPTDILVKVPRYFLADILDVEDYDSIGERLYKHALVARRWMETSYVASMQFLTECHRFYLKTYKSVGVQ